MDDANQPQRGQGFGRGWVPVARDIGLPGDSAGPGAGGAGVSASFGTNGGLLPPLEGRVGEGWLDAGGDAWDFGAVPPPQPLPHGEGLSSGEGLLVREGLCGGFAGAGDPVLTPACKARFLDELARHGNVRVAAGRVGVSRSGLYLARRRDGLFAQGWRAALVLARGHAEAVLAERALEGVEEPVFFRGELIAVRRRYDARLLLAHLARLDAACADESAEESAAGDFDALLAAVAGLPEAAARPDCPSREAAVERAAFRAGARGLGDKRTAAMLEAAAAEWDAAEAALRGALDAALAGGGAAPFEVKALGAVSGLRSTRTAAETVAGRDRRGRGLCFRTVSTVSSAARRRGGLTLPGNSP